MATKTKKKRRNSGATSEEKRAIRESLANGKRLPASAYRRSKDTRSAPMPE